MAPEPESTNQKKVVPHVEEKTQAPAKEPSILDLAEAIPQDKADLAEKMGIPLTKLLSYMKYQEDKLNLVILNMPKKEDITGAFKQGLENLQKEQMAQMQQGAQGAPQGGGGFGQLVPMLRMAMSAGGGDAEMATLTKEMFRMNIEGMKSDISFTKALKNAMLSKYATDMVKKVVP